MQKIVRGVLESAEQSYSDQESTVYNFLRIAASDDRVELIKNVQALKLVSSYLRPGLTATFCFVGSGSEAKLIAISAGGKIASDIDNWETAHNQSRLVAWGAFLLPVACFVYSAFASHENAQVPMMVGGLGLIPMWLFSIKFFRLAASTKIPDLTAVEAALKEA